jgi:hypothetical protein
MFLQSPLHTSHGLMRGNWSSDDSFAFGRTGFELTAEQRTAALEHFAWTQGVTAAHGSYHVDQAAVGHSQLDDYR